MKDLEIYKVHNLYIKKIKFNPDNEPIIHFTKNKYEAMLVDSDDFYTYQLVKSIIGDFITLKITKVDD